jgi:hypothetical protein
VCALVALRALGRDPSLERLDLVPHGLELDVAIASALGERDRGTERRESRKPDREREPAAAGRDASDVVHTGPQCSPFEAAISLARHGPSRSRCYTCASRAWPPRALWIN